MIPRSLGQRAERALLGALLINPAAITTLPDIHAWDFSDTRHIMIFSALARGRRASTATNPGYMASLRRSCPAARHATAYAHLIMRASDRRFPQAPPANGFSPYRCPEPYQAPVFVRAGTAAEENLLSAIIRGLPDALLVTSWLPVRAFQPGPRQDLYAAITRLRERNEPVDELTADWEHAAHGGGHVDSCYGARLARRPARVEDAVCYALLMNIRTSREEEQCHQVR